ncbi:MAG: tetratricopeptide repeat protein [Candidatus Thorarchaeota archaeon]|nr:MAG: tetratricopeptide repeat protein [Candidatus Thorarchaeota archaeon]
MIDKGEYKEALDVVNALAARRGLPQDDHFASLLLEARLRGRLGDPERALSMIEQAHREVESIKNPLLVVDYMTAKIEAFWRSGKIDQGLLLLDECQKLLDRIQEEPETTDEGELRRRQGEYLLQAGIIHWYKGNLEKSREYHQRSLEIRERLGHRRGIADSLNNLALVYQSKGEPDIAADYHERSLKIREELGSKPDIAASYNNLGNIYAIKGEMERALDYHERSLKIREEIGNKQGVAMSLLNVGSITQRIGNLGQALEYYQRSLETFEELGISYMIALALNNIGSAYQMKGDLDQALEYHKRSLAIREELAIKQELALSLLNIGYVHWRKYDFNQAMKHYQRSLEIYEEAGNDPFAALVLYQIVLVALDSDDIAGANQHLQRFEQINSRVDNRVVDQRYRVARALSLKKSKRTRERVKAEEILQRVVSEEITDHSLTVTAMIHLCDLLMLELKLTGEDEVLEKTKNLTQRLLNIAKEQSSHTLLVESYILQSKLALVELDIDQARILLAQAHVIAEEKGLEKLARAVAEERDSLQAELKKWENVVKQQPSAQEMIDLTQLDALLERMIRKTVTVLAEQDGMALGTEAPRRKYRLVHLDLLSDSGKTERSISRVGIAQIGLSQSGDILSELYEEKSEGLFKIREDQVERVREKAREMMKAAHAEGVDLLLFPELAIDLNYGELLGEVTSLAKEYGMHVVPGSYHVYDKKQNLSRVLGPEGVLWEQEKHIPATIHIEGKRIDEGIETGVYPMKTVVCSTEFGRIAITICRDFLDMDLRVELKNSEPPVDIVLNPAFTPVTADFRAAHFDARRSIYAYCFFANVAEFGDSFIHSPEKDRTERNIPRGKEDLIFKDVDLFQLRAERKKWEKQQKKQRAFIQSTR